jgi:hypothetical protein
VSDAPAPRIVVAEASVAPAAAALLPDASQVVLTPAELRPEASFVGALFELLAGLTAGELVGLIVPAVWRGLAAEGGPAAPAPTALVVADHVNLALRGPLTGRWPAGMPRSFPCMTGIYQPSVARAAAGAPVYSEDVVAAGVRDAERLTPFERRALAEAGVSASSDCLVPTVVAAAFYGLKVAACLIVRAARERE